MIPWLIAGVAVAGIGAMLSSGDDDNNKGKEVTDTRKINRSQIPPEAMKAIEKCKRNKG